MTQSAVLFQPTSRGRSFFRNELKARVEGLRFSEINLMYHQLKTGEKLQVKQYVHNGEVHLGLYFKGMRMGSVSRFLSIQMLRNIQKGAMYEAEIFRIERRKFLPPTEIEIILTRCESR